MRTLSTGDAATQRNWKILLYGDNRSGKTHFSGTWPRPVFLVPEQCLNEMRTLADQDLVVLPFANLNECQQQIEDLVKAVAKGLKVGGRYVPRTMIFDNMTSAQMLWEEEIKRTQGKTKLEWDDWGEIKSMTQRAIVAMGQVDLHQIWITHSRSWTVSKGAGATEERGGFTLQGSTRDVLPNHCDLMLFAEARTISPSTTTYHLHARRRGIWPAGVRLTRIHKDKVLTEVGPDPHYDDLAPYLGLPSLVEEEGEEQATAAAGVTATAAAGPAPLPGVTKPTKPKK